VIKLVPADNATNDYVRNLPNRQVANPLLSFTTLLRQSDKTKNRSINQLLRYLGRRWQVKKRLLSLKLCKSSRDMVRQESQKTLTTFTYPCPFKVCELNNLVEHGKRPELTFLYSIARPEEADSDISSDSYSDSSSDTDSLEAAK